MNINIIQKRKEVILILFTGIIIAFLIGIISDIFFKSLFVGNELSISLISIVGLLISSSFAYFIILSKTENLKVSIKFPFTFDKNHLVFVDIPSSPPSLHARYLFDNLSMEEKRNLASYDLWDKFFNSPFDKFINEVVQETLLILLFRRLERKRQNWKSFKFAELPYRLQKNEHLKKSYGHEKVSIRMPTWATIETFGNNDLFLRIKSKYGIIELKWNISVTQIPYLSKYYISILSINNNKYIHDFIIDVSLVYNCKFWQMFSRGIIEYENWIEELENDFRKLDWQNSYDIIPLELLKEILNKLR